MKSCFIPIHPEMTNQTKLRIVESSNARVAICNKELMDENVGTTQIKQDHRHWIEYLKAKMDKLILVDSNLKVEIVRLLQTERPRLKKKDAAYCMFSSGTTGDFFFAFCFLEI